jgi:hypothetical protein
MSETTMCAAFARTREKYAANSIVLVQNSNASRRNRRALITNLPRQSKYKGFERAKPLVLYSSVYQQISEE